MLKKSKKYMKKLYEALRTIGSFFTILWIVAWFGACWVYHLQLFFTGLFSLFLSYVCYDAKKDMESEL